MIERTHLWTIGKVILAVLLIVALVWVVVYAIEHHEEGIKDDVLGVALDAKFLGGDAAQKRVADAIVMNYQSTRKIAKTWSGVHWAFMFIAAALSGLSALVLKLESFLKSEARKKDLAAFLSVVAALLITISTSGDFQRKWQANRIAAAELERMGYQFLKSDGADADSYYSTIGQVLLRRHMAIIGSSDQTTSVSPGS